MKAVGKIWSRHLKDNSALTVTLFESLTLKGSDIHFFFKTELLPIFQCFFTHSETEKMAFE